MNRTLFRRRAGAAAFAFVLASCGSDGDGATPSGASASFVSQVRAAADAVEQARSGPQEYFEITATPQLTNVFVAVDGATAAIPYVYLDGELQPPGPKLPGAAGNTFTAAAIDFDEDAVSSGLRSDLPTSSIDAFSVEGGPGGFVRYVFSVRSEQGGVLDVVVAANGAVIEVNPL